MIFKFQKSFSAAHFYKQPQWSDEKNRLEFGLCFHPQGHGHDYTLEIDLDCEEAQATAAREVFDQVIATYDHQHLNFKVPEFQTKVPTTENLVLLFERELQSAFKPLALELLNLRLQETPEIWVEKNVST